MREMKNMPRLKMIEVTYWGRNKLKKRNGTFYGILSEKENLSVNHIKMCSE